MPTDVLMPQMGESVAEGTIVRWIKKVGDAVDKDEPLFEISTDKVDAEIPAPAAGTLVAIRVAEGDTVAVNSVVAIIGEEISGTTGSTGSTGPRNELTPSASSVPQSSGATSSTGTTGTTGSTGPRSELTPSSSSVRQSTDASSSADLMPLEPKEDGQRSSHLGPVAPVEPVVPGLVARRRTRSSPVVRRIAADHDIDISRLTGSGISGRVTRRDLEDLVRRRPGRTEDRAPALPPPYAPGDRVRIEKMSVMRKKIAEHMRASVQTSPHVYSTYDVDFAHVEALRAKHKARYDREGVKLTYTVFIARAAAEALRECPFANASIDDDNVVYKEDINLGMAVALDQGLIVPVIRHADRLSVLDLGRAIQDLAGRARAKQLKVDEVQGGTFTITNPGVFGAAFGFPIISQPQVAILAVGSIDKRAVVMDDQIVVRPMCYLTLGHDHRLIDGADGARFLRAMKDRIERFDEALL